MLRVLILFCLISLWAGRVDAQCLIDQDDIQLSDQSVISLITVNPGSQIQTFWGHTALRIKDPVNNLDLLYNYGAFQFDATFVPKFIYGKLDYVLCVSPMRHEVQKYRLYQKRSLIEQKLRLSLEEKQVIFDFVENNALPENRTYRYDFLFDNCSTRIRDLLEDVLGDRLTYHYEAPDSTYRQILQPYVRNLPFLSLGIDVGLGMPVDRKPTARELMGLPIYMMEAYDKATVEIDGMPMPLVMEKGMLLEIDLPESIGNKNARFLFYGLLGGLMIVGFWVTFSKAPAIGRLRLWFDRLVFGFTGFVGLLAVFLWFIALHNVTNFNLNLLWAWPTHVGLLWMMIRRKKAVAGYMRVYTILAGIVVVGWEFWPQELNEFLIPFVLTMMLRSAWWGWFAKTNQ